MQEFWLTPQFEKVVTEDDSPTLRALAIANQETMHHRGGAYAETQQIYGDQLRQVLAQGARSCVSVGLGLGYNEILTAVEALKYGIRPSDFALLSFESEAILREQFLKWVHQDQPEKIYDEVWSFFAREPQAPAKEQVQKWLRSALDLKSWKLQAALEPSFEISQKFECIFYDAFSSKSSPHLWQEDFLEKFWQSTCAARAVVTTYACTGALKRSLKNQGFTLVLPSGFHSKRNRTMGARGFALKA